jgi:hypothetical protein
MREKMFAFDPESHRAQFEREGWVHIRSGLTEGFRVQMQEAVNRFFAERRLEHLRVGDKLQALYEFPEGRLEEFLEGVGRVCGLEPARLVLTERHIKTYEATANPSPLAHKDRYSSQVSIGFSVTVPEGSTLVLYPKDDLETNPFNSSTEYRRSFTADRTPETRLKGARPVEIQDRPGDVVMFYGSRIWHLRRNAANTVMLYFKVNDFDCDTLGEDPRTQPIRERSRAAASGAADAAFGAFYPVLGRAVESFQRRIGRDGNELVGVLVAGTGHVTIEEWELELLRALDGKSTAAEVVRFFGGEPHVGRSLRRFAECGAIDLYAEAR